MIDNRILAQHVYEYIRSMIITGKYPPGDKIEKKVIGETLGVSQTPVNEALSRLVGEKYLDQITRRGFFVKAFSTADLREMFEVRAALEGIAVRLCIERANTDVLDRIADMFCDFSLPIEETRLHDYLEVDRAFHNSIIELSGNSMVREMSERFGYLFKSYQPGLIRGPKETLPEHNAIARALRNRAADEAQQLMTQHHLKTVAVLC